MGTYMKDGTIKKITKEEFTTVKKLKGFFKNENECMEKFYP